MILSDSRILEEIKKGTIVVTPFKPEIVGSNSVDVHLGKTLCVYKDKILDAKRHNEIQCMEIPGEGQIIYPDFFYLGVTMEYTETHAHVPFLEGKCFSPGTLIRGENGRIMEIDQVQVGMLIPTMAGLRRVKAIHKGRSPMYRVDQKRGMSYTVNEGHLLMLTCNHDFSKEHTKGSYHSVPVEQFKDISNSVRLLGYRSAMDLPDAELPIDPYIFGVWLGDGCHKHARLTINVNDQSIVDTLVNKYPMASVKSYKPGAQTIVLSTHRKVAFKRPNAFLNSLRMMGVYGNKHIPDAYLQASLQQRLSLLAGILDTDGYANHCCYEITLASKLLFNGVIDLAQSCGFTCNPTTKKVNGKTYFRTTIVGDVSAIPLKVTKKRDAITITKSDRSKSPLSVSPVGEGEYIGFELDSELELGRQFFLADNTVVHNSSTGRLGIDIHATAGKGDVGFCGYWTLEISVKQPVRVYAGMPIGQLIYFPVQGEIINPYNKKQSAKYNDQPNRPVESMMWKNTF